MTLFVDVDETLIDFDDHPRMDMVAAVFKWSQENPYSPVVIWSGGGLSYADLWRRRIFGAQHFTALAKGTTVHTEDDLCVDDMWESMQRGLAEVISPDEFVSRQFSFA